MVTLSVSASGVKAAHVVCTTHQERPNGGPMVVQAGVPTTFQEGQSVGTEFREPA